MTKKKKPTATAAQAPTTAIRARRAPAATKKRRAPPASTPGAAILLRCRPAERKLLQDAAAHRTKRAIGDLGYEVKVPTDRYVLQVALAEARRELAGDELPAVLQD